MIYVYDVTSKKNNCILFTMTLYNKDMKEKWLKEINKKKKVINIIPRKFDLEKEGVNNG